MSNGSDGSQRITLSQETLRLELANLELSLLNKLASKDSVEKVADRVSALEHAAITREFYDKERDEWAKVAEELRGRVKALEEEKAGREAVEGYKKWWLGGGALAGVMLLVTLAIQLYTLTRPIHGK
jgi:hypothetical protein